MVSTLTLVGIDLFGLIRLKPSKIRELTTAISCRDWSVWIDTIETLVHRHSQTVPFPPSGLSCLDWYDWNYWNFSQYSGSWLVGIDLFGLIRLKRHLWRICQVVFVEVGIDLSELIRLKLKLCLIEFATANGRDWSVWIDTIETYQLTRNSTVFHLSGLICLDWYDWNSRMRKIVYFIQPSSGLICLDWYDWKLSKEPQSKSHNRVVGIISLFDSF